MTSHSLRIASYNIRKARGLDQKRLPMRSLDVVNSLSADIVLLQEADKRMGMRKPAIDRRLIEHETDFQLLEVSSNGISLGWHGNAVLFRKGIKINAVTCLELPGLEPRGAVQLDLDIGTGLSVVATHLGLLRKDRRAQLAEIGRAVADKPAAIIAGDLNEWSQHKGFEPLADRFSIHAPGLSFHARRPVASLDRFALTDDVTLEDAGVEQGQLAKQASDHLPIWSDVSVPEAVTC